LVSYNNFPVFFDKVHTQAYPNHIVYRKRKPEL